MHEFTHLDKQQHGTLVFPVEYYYVDSMHPRYQMPFHWHNEWEILRVLDGKLRLFLDDEIYDLETGDVVLMRGEMLHGGEPANCIYECLVFDLYGLFRKMDMVKPCLRPFYRQTRIPQCKFPAQKDGSFHSKVSELMKAFSEKSDPGCCELKTVVGIGSLFAWIYENGRYQQLPEQEYAASRRVGKIKSVLEYIEANYNTNLSLDELAQIAGMNPKYFCRVFRSLTHHSPMDYVNFYRIEQAAYLLDSTDLPVTAVGNECGFWESGYFTKVFKKYKSCTPLEYRRSVLGRKMVGREKL